jgi:hypothetical protein
VPWWAVDLRNCPARPSPFTGVVRGHRVVSPTDTRFAAGWPRHHKSTSTKNCQLQVFKHQHWRRARTNQFIHRATRRQRTISTKRTICEISSFDVWTFACNSNIFIVWIFYFLLFLTVHYFQPNPFPTYLNSICNFILYFNFQYIFSFYTFRLKLK